MSPATAQPPSPVLWGFARLMQGASADSVACADWPEPWQGIARQVAGANGHRQEVLRDCLQRTCGDQAELLTRSIFAQDPAEKPVEDAPGGWEPAVPLPQIELPSFPTDAFPAWLRGFVDAEAEATQTPPDMAAMLALSVLALALARKVIVHVKPGWLEPVNLWTLTTMEPANRKSAVVRDLMAPMADFLREETQRVAPSIREALARRKVLEDRSEYLRGRAARAQDLEAERLLEESLQLGQEASDVDVPPSPKLWTDDCTPEMMGSLLAEHGGRMGVISAEGNVLELMAGRYSKGHPNIGVYLAGHAGDAYLVDRRGRPSEYVPHPAITIGITVQKEVLQGLADKPGFRGCGLLARFLYSFPRSRLGRRKSEPEPVSPALQETYRRHVLTLLSLPFGTSDTGEPAAHVLHLDPAARSRLRDYQETLEPQLAPHGELGTISDWAGKLCGAVARIAGLLHVAEQGRSTAAWEAPIAASTMDNALRIGDYLTAHARAAFGIMSEDPQVDTARFILGWLRRKQLTSFRERDLHRNLMGNARFKRVGSLRPALDLLEEQGLLRRRPPEKATGPGRTPSPCYDVHPDAASFLEP